MNPHWFQYGSGSESSFYLNADAIRIQPAKPMRIHADPDHGQSLSLQKNILKVRYVIGQKHTYEGTKAFLKGRKPGQFWSIFMLKDPDPHSQCGSGSGFPILIQDSQMNVDP